MKKILFTLALAAFGFTANAQFIIGGQIGYGNTGGTDKFEANGPVNAYDVPNNKSSNLTIAPTISYVLNDNMQAGLTLSFTSVSNTNYTAAAYALDKEVWTKNTTNIFTIAPYFRYYFANINKFNFFCEAQLGFSTTGRTNGHTYNNTITPVIDEDIKGATSSTSVFFSIIPGVNYRINEHFSADCYIDLAGLVFLSNSTKNYGALTTSGWDDDFLVHTNTNNYFGLTANAAAQDLNTQFGNFRIGFNYHF